MISVEFVEFEANFDYFLNKVADDKETIMITRDGKGYVVMVPYDEYQAMIQQNGP